MNICDNSPPPILPTPPFLWEKSNPLFFQKFRIWGGGPKIFGCFARNGLIKGINLILYFAIPAIRASPHKKWIFVLKISAVNVTRFAGKCRIWSHLLKKCFMENFVFCAVLESLYTSVIALPWWLKLWKNLSISPSSLGNFQQSCQFVLKNGFSGKLQQFCKYLRGNSPRFFRTTMNSFSSWTLSKFMKYAELLDDL